MDRGAWQATVPAVSTWLSDFHTLVLLSNISIGYHVGTQIKILKKEKEENKGGKKGKGQWESEKKGGRLP